MPKMHNNDDGRFRVVGDGRSAQDPFRQMIVASMSGPTMRRFSAAAALLIAGRPGSDLRAPEPLIQVGFEPSEGEMDAIVQMARVAGRDLIHVGCHDDGSGKPTGMIAVVFFEDGKTRPHRRAGLLCSPGNTNVYLAGVSDVEDETCHFVLSPAKKMQRLAGYPVDDIGAGMKRAGELWLKRAEAIAAADCSREVLRIPGVLEGPGGPAA